ncbi:NTPase [Candidatus Bathyarchaeota archaeon]|nr:NTPase [Candidatus Bathyarchaeota archaeon]
MTIMYETIMVTGMPGIGKTTLISNVVEIIKDRGYLVGGMITQEIRDKQKRLGFEILDIYTGKKGILAHTSLKKGSKIGKYVVNAVDLDEVGVAAITNSLNRPEIDLVVVDETGPMEITSANFRKTVAMAIRGSKPFLGTVQFKLRNNFMKILDLTDLPKIIEITYENRNIQIDKISKEILKIIEKKH